MEWAAWRERRRAGSGWAWGMAVTGDVCGEAEDGPDHGLKALTMDKLCLNSVLAQRLGAG